MRLFDLQVLQQRVQVVGELLERIGAFRGPALAVPARVVSEHAVLRLVPLDLAVPHAHAARERVAEYEPGGGAPVAMDFVIGLDAVDGRFHAVSTIKGIIISSALGPPWLPICRWRGSPAVQSFTV